jgi:phospholipid-translocating ATPase
VSIDRKDGKEEYNAASPDELAFVEFTEKCGMKFEGKDSDDIVTLKDTITNGKDEPIYHKIKLVGVCEFTSDRKMSSNIYKDEANETYTIYTKGADSEIEKVINNGAKSNEMKQLEAFTKERIEDFSLVGLRTLLIAKKPLMEEEFLEWKKDCEAANEDMDNREELLAKAHEIVEWDL